MSDLYLMTYSDPQKKRDYDRERWRRRRYKKTGLSTVEELYLLKQLKNDLRWLLARIRNEASEIKAREHLEHRAKVAAMPPDERRAYKLANMKRWREENRDRHRESKRPHKRNRRHLMRGDGCITSGELEAMRKKYGKRCALCGVGGKMTIDHIVPMSRGGRHEASNIQFLCLPCNSAKRDMPMEEFARKRGFLI
jgi:5-methylcytosine-specific restriction endonuclease McrA